jgi:hypothetical protein
MGIGYIGESPIFYQHPNHTGEVTSVADGATTVADNIIDEANLKCSNSPTDGHVLVARSGNSGGMTWEAPSGGGGSSSWTIVSEEHNDTNPTGGSHASGTTYDISAYTDVDAILFYHSGTTGSGGNDRSAWGVSTNSAGSSGVAIEGYAFESSWAFSFNGATKSVNSHQGLPMGTSGSGWASKSPFWVQLRNLGESTPWFRTWGYKYNYGFYATASGVFTSASSTWYLVKHASSQAHMIYGK